MRPELFNPEKLPGFTTLCWRRRPPEAQRFRLESHASDLNPVAVTINKAMIEIPPKFAGGAPVGPEIPSDKPARKSHQRCLLKIGPVPRVGGRCAPLWCLDARAGTGAHRPSYPKVFITEAMVTERPDLAPYLG